MLHDKRNPHEGEAQCHLPSTTVQMIEAVSITIFAEDSSRQWRILADNIRNGASLVQAWAAAKAANAEGMIAFVRQGTACRAVSDAEELLHASRAEVLHCGGADGYAAAMPVLRYVHPAALLYVSPSESECVSSPALSLEHCYVAKGALLLLEGPFDVYECVHAQSFAIGWDLVEAGAILRTSLELRAGATSSARCHAMDQLQFARAKFGRLWGFYVWLRLTAAGALRAGDLVAGLVRVAIDVRGATARAAPALRRSRVHDVDEAESVTVLIPTIDRNDYLRSTLGQLRAQTHRPTMVVVVDQTPEDRRDLKIEEDFADLPICVIWREVAGQSSSRNAGIHQISTKWTLLLDDDVDLPDDLIKRHVSLCLSLKADASVGVAVEDGVPPLPERLRGWRLSPVLNGNNSLVRTSLLKTVGGFDHAFDGGSRADGELGVRLHKAGALMLLDGENSLFHHHAPRGGLRVHRARVVTRATARQRVLGRHPVVPTELYISLRHFGEWSVKELCYVRLLSGLRMEGGILAMLARAMVGLIRLPSERRFQKNVEARAREMMGRFPVFGSFT